MFYSLGGWRRAAASVRPFFAFAVSCALFASGLATLYRVDAATLARHGSLYETLDQLYLAVWGTHIFAEPYLDLPSLVWMGGAVTMFSLCCLMLTVFCTYLLNAFIRGGAAWQEAAELLRESSAPQSAHGPSPARPVGLSHPALAAPAVGRITDYGYERFAEHRCRSGGPASGTNRAPHTGRQPDEN
ncbi:hypothetical protein [Paraburkholderia sp. BCC1876]|uniref:hypothetical protein n=1 Tax=Paraburkholderia sp. BCC1876 TaxID=2676303 RepID=UPI0015923FBE|nr:hypothetical protein [Paraburkholderia sp. BCC1876]